MDTLGKLFETPARVKLMRLFLFNPHEVFETREIRTRSQIAAPTLRRELSRLCSAGLIRQKSAYKAVPRRERGRRVMRKKRIRGWLLDDSFPYLEPLQVLLLDRNSFQRRSILSRLRAAGRIKLLIISGFFLHDEQNRVDVLIVGDRLRPAALHSALKALESEAGKELRYTALSTNDFLYRLGIHDKFVRDVLDYPHEKLIDRLGIQR